ncbi:MAG: DUF2147 domain-containing protein [Flavobacteriaceae bacterium]|nr:DUF2147 domain-containing protein [Flavobacteriaceae bacterium]
MKRFFMVILLIGMVSFIQGQTIFGKWKTIDPDTGKDESIIEVYKKDGKAYAKIIAIINEADRDKTCINCTGKNKNKPILGLDILDGLEEKGDEWSGGRILDPKNGKYYKCYLKLITNNKLKLRGYIGISLLGRTEYWYRYRN